MSKGPQQAAPLKLSRKSTVAELGSAALASAAEQMRSNTRGALNDRGPDYGHQLRIGARRARVLVRLFRGRIGKVRAAALQRELRWAFRCVGAVHDYDMLLTQVIGPLTHDEVVPELELLAGEVMRRRRYAAARVKRALGSKRYARLSRDLARLERELARTDDKRAKKWIKKRLEERLDAVLSMREAVFGGSEAAQHELRKQLKKLRYSAEFARGLWGKKQLKHYLGPMKALQDALGGVIDTVTAHRLLGELARRAAFDLPAALALCEARLAAQLTERVSKLAPAYAAFEQTRPFWR